MSINVRDCKIFSVERKKKTDRIPAKALRAVCTYENLNPQLRG
jgi:hypothetical protein